MARNLHTISNLGEFVKLITDYYSKHSPGWVYRGHANSAYELKPKAGREPYWFDDKTDLDAFDDWCHQAIQYDVRLPSSKFERMALAQHYGLATRMLDWTANPLVSLYFAAEVSDRKKVKDDADGCVICYRPEGEFQRAFDQIPFESVTDVLRYNPPAFDARIRAQSGLFTYHPNPSTALEEKPTEIELLTVLWPTNLAKINVPADRKRSILDELALMNISRRTLFPDLDGLSYQINFETAKRVLQKSLVRCMEMLNELPPGALGPMIVDALREGDGAAKD